MRRHRWQATGVLLLLGVSAACGGPATTPTESAPAVTPTSELPTATPGTPQTVDICRAAIVGGYGLSDAQEQALELLVFATADPAAGHIFTDGSSDYECYTSPPGYCAPGYDTQYADCTPRIVDQYRRDVHLADLLDDQTHVAGRSPGGCCGGYGSYTSWWGAASSDVSRLSVTIGNEELETTGDAVLQNGYFLALFGDIPCCLYTYIAYDEAGAVIDQR